MEDESAPLEEEPYSEEDPCFENYSYSDCCLYVRYENSSEEKQKQIAEEIHRTRFPGAVPRIKHFMRDPEKPSWYYYDSPYRAFSGMPSSSKELDLDTLRQIYSTDINVIKETIANSDKALDPQVICDINCMLDIMSVHACFPDVPFENQIMYLQYHTIFDVWDPQVFDVFLSRVYDFHEGRKVWHDKYNKGKLVGEWSEFDESNKGVENIEVSESTRKMVVDGIVLNAIFDIFEVYDGVCHDEEKIFLLYWLDLPWQDEEIEANGLVITRETTVNDNGYENTDIFASYKCDFPEGLTKPIASQVHRVHNVDLDSMFTTDIDIIQAYVDHSMYKGQIDATLVAKVNKAIIKPAIASNNKDIVRGRGRRDDYYLCNHIYELVGKDWMMVSKYYNIFAIDPKSHRIISREFSFGFDNTFALDHPQHMEEMFFNNYLVKHFGYNFRNYDRDIDGDDIDYDYSDYGDELDETNTLLEP